MLCRQTRTTFCTALDSARPCLMPEAAPIVVALALDTSRSENEAAAMTAAIDAMERRMENPQSVRRDILGAGCVPLNAFRETTLTVEVTPRGTPWHGRAPWEARRP